MTIERQRQNATGGDADEPGGAENLEALRAAGAAHLEAARRALREVLSEDSEAFLRAARQSGGE